MLLSDKTKGYTGSILSAVAYGLNPLFAIPLYDRGLTTQSVLFYRFLMASAILAVFLLVQKKSFRLTPRQIPGVLLLGITCTLSAFTLFLSFLYLPSGIAVTLAFTCPLWVVLIQILCFRERPTITVLTGLILAFFGVFLISGGCSGGAVGLGGLLIGLFSGLSYAVYMVIIEKSSLKTLPTETQTFYGMLASFCIFGVYFLVAPFFPALPNLQGIPGISGFFWLAGLAFFCTFLAFWLIAVGIRYVGPAITAIVGALEPLTAVVVGILVFQEVLTPSMIFGIILILVSFFAVIGKKPKKA